jgi:hypothetical protein
MKYYDENPIQWNMAQAFLMRLDNRLNDFQINYHQGNLKSCYLLLKSIIGTVAFKIKNIEEYEQDLHNLKLKIRTLNPKLSSQSIEINVEIVEDLIYNLYKKLNYDLYESELIFQKKEEYDFESIVRASYE